MKTAQVTPNLRYISLGDAEGEFGIFIVHLNGYVYHTMEVYSKEEFKSAYEQLQEIYGVDMTAA
tara:strand:- start:516 stop:707 length:192 start_codon:yes stop_codon:yes gene_type:complete